MRCIICKREWDNAGLVTGEINLTTVDSPRSLSLTNQPICAACIRGMSERMADNALEAVEAIEKAKGIRGEGVRI